MGLLDILDYHYENGNEESVEVEYHLLSWGEIYPPFVGDREHSTTARFILQDLPFKLFSVLIPYSELPQKFCLTFRNPMIVRGTEKVTSIGSNQHDVAKEFAAFLSLFTRRRIFSLGQTRENGLPMEQMVNMYARPHSQERQQLKEINPSEVYRLLMNLQRMDREIARSFILSMRLYHSAVEIMYSEPEFAYLFLVLSIEAIASKLDIKLCDNGEGRTELEEYLDSTYRGWRDYCDISTREKRQKVVDMLLEKAYFVRRKFQKFVQNNLPEVFWNETEDDAKPDYVYSVIAAGPDGKGREYMRHSDKTIQKWERIEKNKLKQALDNIYNARSEFVHEGARFSASIMVGHFRKIPFEATKDMFEAKYSATSGQEIVLKVPPLLTFERLVSYTLIEFLSKQGSLK